MICVILFLANKSPLAPTFAPDKYKKSFNITDGFLALWADAKAIRDRLFS